MSRIKEYAIETFQIEASAIIKLSELLTDDFDKAVLDTLKCKGKVIVTGMGKSGLIGTKIAATLACTGTPAFFMHPGEAYHGDLGMIASEDIILAISNSGQTDEVLKLIPFLKDNGNIIIGMCGNPESTLAKHSTYHLNIAIDREACPLQLAPTASTTATLAMGDAFAIALLNERGFKAEDFARFHPGGSLGKRLLTKVRDVMRQDNLPCVAPNMKLNDVIIAISKARLGLAIVMSDGVVVGVVTDGDVRRAMLKYQERFFGLEISEVMTISPKTILDDAKVTDAEKIMVENKIHSLLVTSKTGELVGVVEFYDLTN